MLSTKIINKQRIKYSMVALVAVLVIFFLFNGKNNDDLYDTVLAKKGELLQEVNVTGRVKPAKSVNLAFEKTGKISQVFTEVGNNVFKGSLLVRLENSDIIAQLNQAQANVKIQNAKLDELNRGYREEEIEIQRVKVANAEVSLNEAKTNVVDTLRDAFTKSDNAVRNNVDQLFTNPRGNSPDLNFLVNNNQLENQIEQQRVQTETILNSWLVLLPSIIASSDLDAHIVTTKNNLNIVKDLLDNVALAVNTVLSYAILTQATIDGYKTDISTARTNVNTAISNTSTSEEKYNNAISALTLAEQELILKEAGTVEEQIIAQQAKVEESRASVQNYQAQLSKTLIYAPFSGVVTKQDAKVGEVITGGTSIISIISESEFEIETNVPEVDIVKLSIGDVAQVTLDAYGDGIFFDVIVTDIEPAETIIEGVATYKTTLQFTQKDDRIKSGMTANIDILTDSRDNVVFVPGRSVIKNNGNNIVRIIKDESFVEVEVTIGLRGSDGSIEIIDGIMEGDEVIIFIKDK